MSESDNLLEFAGSYRLVRRIAEGGMANVYEAELLGPEGFAKRVALKVIHPKYARSSNWLRLFVDEAKLSANLVHGNIVQIYQLGEVNGQYYIAMEYIQGPTLRNVIDRHREIGRPITPAIAAYIASRVCRALDFAHNFIDPDGRRLDIVHRDVSPGNVMATWDGHIKLADFGIAKAATSFDPVAETPMMIGKKHYMSPEQILALNVDGQSDVFSLGVVLFELLSLEPLFREDVTELVIDEVTIHPLPSIRDFVPGIPTALEHVLSRALARDPAQRPSAASMGKTLDRWVESLPGVATPDRLQEHLAAIMPGSYQSRSEDRDNTKFSHLGRRLQTPVRTLVWRLLGI
ncbi:MAG: serine/threonine-protein kinase [Gemmatimonadaceae bacterium]